jgi:hypothetical protein
MDRAITASTGRDSSKKASLNPVPTPKCRGLKALEALPSRTVTTAMRSAVPRLPPRKKSIEFMLSADASICTRTMRETVAAKGVFTNPNPAPNIPANNEITQTEAPAYVERPSTASNISGDPVQIGRRAPRRSVILPAAITAIEVNIALGSRTNSTSNGDRR